VITLRKKGALVIALLAAVLTALVAGSVPASATPAQVTAAAEVDQAIVNDGSGHRCLDAAWQGHGANGTPVQLWDCLGVNQTNQRWYLRWVTPGRFQLVNKAGGRCLDATAQGNGANGTRIQLWDCYGAGQLNQLWEPVWDTAGTFRVAIRNVASRRLLDAAAEGNGANATPIQLWDDAGPRQTNQRWNSPFFRTYEPRGTHYLHNLVTGKCADILGASAGSAGNVVNQYMCDVSMKLRITPVARLLPMRRNAVDLGIRRVCGHIG
jgi:hypothetical protein